MNEETKARLYDILRSKLDSMLPCSQEKWNEALERVGAFWAEDERECSTHQFIMVWDPFIRMVGSRKIKRILIVPNDLALRILALGGLP